MRSPDPSPPTHPRTRPPTASPGPARPGRDPPGRATHDPARRATSRVWLAAAAVVGLAVGAASAWALTRHDSDDRVAGAVEYAGPMDGPDGRTVAAELAVIATGIGRVVELDTDALPVLPTGELYEIWFVAPNDAADAPVRISAGTFHPDPDGRSHVQMTAAADPRSTRSSR